MGGADFTSNMCFYDNPHMIAIIRIRFSDNSVKQYIHHVLQLQTYIYVQSKRHHM